MSETKTRTKTLRFRRQPFASFPREPRWHTAARPYNPRQLYNAVQALCGYEIKGLTAMTVTWSYAKNKPRGPHCLLCGKGQS